LNFTFYPGVNPKCMESGTIKEIVVEKFDGQNWEESMEKELEKTVSIQSRSK